MIIILVIGLCAASLRSKLYITGNGYEVLLRYDTTLTTYFNGKEMTFEDVKIFQNRYFLKQDGIVGHRTIQKMLELNRLDVRGK